MFVGSRQISSELHSRSLLFTNLGCWRKKLVAIKTLKDGSMDPAKFLDEAKIMKQLRHRKLVALYAVCSTQEPFYIITELMSNGCLLDYLRKDHGRLIHLPNLLDIAGQVR